MLLDPYSNATCQTFDVGHNDRRGITLNTELDGRARTVPACAFQRSGRMGRQHGSDQGNQSVRECAGFANLGGCTVGEGGELLRRAFTG